MFDLGGTVAAHDCNCRCYIEYNLMTAEEFAKATGKKVANIENSGIIDVEGFRKLSKAYKERQGLKFISKERFDQLTIEARKNGAIIIRGGKDVNKHLDEYGAAAAIIGDAILFRDNVCISEVLEETYHFKQNLAGLNTGKPKREILNEIDAKNGC